MLLKTTMPRNLQWITVSNSTFCHYRTVKWYGGVKKVTSRMLTGNKVQGLSQSSKWRSQQRSRHNSFNKLPTLKLSYHQITSMEDKVTLRKSLSSKSSQRPLRHSRSSSPGTTLAHLSPSLRIDPSLTRVLVQINNGVVCKIRKKLNLHIKTGCKSHHTCIWILKGNKPVPFNIPRCLIRNSLSLICPRFKCPSLLSFRRVGLRPLTSSN